MHRQVLAWTAWLAMTPAWAGPILPDGEAQQLLKRYVGAVRQQSYAGVYLHQVGGTVESYRLAHSHEGGVAREKRESLDGVRWELVRVERRFQWYGRDGDWSFQPITSTSRVASGSGTIAADGALRIVAVAIVFIATDGTIKALELMPRSHFEVSRTDRCFPMQRRRRSARSQPQ